jgi:branched-chain amino acid transport system ATP-binding protein
MTSEPALIAVDRLTAGYGMIDVLHEVSFRVPEGSVVALLGANGAGKTTTLNSISGFTQVRSGEITFRGEGLTGQRPDRIVRHGIAHVPEGRHIFPELSVIDNLRIGAYSNRKGRPVRELIEDVLNSFPRLRERRTSKGGQLSGGEQQMLAFGRALMSEPKVLLLDEPSLGLAPRLIAEIARHIREFHERGLTVLLVEQNANMALALADYAYVLELGRVVAEGTEEELRGNDAIRRAYLGVTAA